MIHLTNNHSAIYLIKFDILFVWHQDRVFLNTQVLVLWNCLFNNSQLLYIYSFEVSALRLDAINYRFIIYSSDVSARGPYCINQVLTIIEVWLYIYKQLYNLQLVNIISLHDWFEQHARFISLYPRSMHIIYTHN